VGLGHCFSVAKSTSRAPGADRRKTPSVSGATQRAACAEYGRTDAGPMILLRGVQIVHFGSISGDEWDIVIGGR
jgi:hypothetical protein